jgi:hypothetical protein
MDHSRERRFQSQRCGARTPSGTPCQRPAIRGRKRCRLHGGLNHENLVMSARNPVGDSEKATAVVADDWEETLRRVGGSQSDDWNHVLGNQAIQSLWIEQSDNEVRERQYNAAIAGLIGIAPQDEIEGMIAAQLIATHNATMECYRRAMIGEPRGPARQPQPSEQAVPHLRGSTRCTQSPPRQGGQQKVTVEHVHVHAGDSKIRL